MTEPKKIQGMAVRISDGDQARILEAFASILRSSYLMWGEWQEQLVAKFCEMSGRARGVTFNSCTSALEVLFRQLVDAGRNDVCLQANAFPAVAFAAHRAGMEITWADIDPVAMCPLRSQIEEAFGRRPFDVLVMQWTGGFVTSEVRDIERLCSMAGVTLIEDASHSAGSRSADGAAAGSFGYASVFSLAATKPLQTGQGGMLLTDDEGLADRSFRLKNYGRTEMFQRGEFVHEGWNMHMTELQAAVGVVLMESMERAIEHRRQLANLMLGDHDRPGLQVTALGNWAGRPNLYKLPIRLPDGVSKDELKEAAAAQNVELGSSIYDFVTPHLGVFGGAHESEAFPQCLEFSQRHVCLPLHNALTADDAERVVEVLAPLLSTKTPA